MKLDELLTKLNASINLEDEAMSEKETAETFGDGGTTPSGLNSKPKKKTEKKKKKK